jgi:hypothetical protein
MIPPEIMESLSLKINGIQPFVEGFPPGGKWDSMENLFFREWACNSMVAGDC